MASTELVDSMASARAYLAAEKADNTRRAYRADWADFDAWCQRGNVASLPAVPADVARYLAQLADSGRKVSTIQRRAAAIAYLHKAVGHEPPTNFEGVKAVLRGRVTVTVHLIRWSIMCTVTVTPIQHWVIKRHAAALNIPSNEVHGLVESRMPLVA